MRVLAIDTSSKVLGVGLLDEKGRELELNYSFDLRHASHLAPTIKMLLKFAGLTLKDIDAYCVSIGPGSFTGLRIGVSAVKALAVLDKKKVVAVPSLDVLASNIPYTDDTICVVVDAKKERLYSAFYKYQSGKIKKISKNLLIGYDDLRRRIKEYKHGLILTGDGIEKIKDIEHRTPNLKFFDKEFWYPRAINVARIGLKMLKEKKTIKNVDRLMPLYLYPMDVQCRK